MNKMDFSKHKLQMIMELCGEIIEDLSGPEEIEEEMSEEKPIAAIEVTKVSGPEELEEGLEEEDEEEEKKMPKRFGRLRMD
jgi:hypothetical protein